MKAGIDDVSFVEHFDMAGNRTLLDLEIDVDSDWLLDVYKSMVITRRLDREFIRLQRQGQLGVYPSCLGQEGAQVGAAFALSDEDWAFPQYRELGIALVKGIEPAGLAHLWRGTWLAHRDPSESRYALTQITIGTQVPQAVGFAMGARLAGEPIAVLACFGDGATSTGDVHEAMNFAGVFDAPCVFFVQNNQYAISVPLSSQTAAPTLAHKAVGYGMPGYRCDGNDVLATYAVTRHAVERARRGDGPSLVEAVTYRMEAHTTSDDPTRYRTKGEMDAASTSDPIRRFERFLEQHAMWSHGLGDRCMKEADTAAMKLRDDIYQAPHGDPLELFEHVYVDPVDRYDRQRAILQAELDARGEG